VTLPETLRVKISSETAESIGITPVVVQEMSLEELIRLMLGVTGRDAARIRELLLRGTLVSGASRFRWPGFESDPADVAAYLARYPQPDPTRQFNPQECFQAVLRCGSKPLLLEREAGLKRRMFRGQSFWDELMSLTAGARYLDYSYREQADVFRLPLTLEQQRTVQSAARLLAYTTVEKQIAASGVDRIDLFVRR
jgi:hypothetical protein